MSHFTTVRTKLNNQSTLKKALRRMGFESQEGDFAITQYGITERAQLKIDNAVGLAREKDGTYSMVGDFWHSPNSKLKKYYGQNDQFVKDLSAAYAVEKAFFDLEEKNFFCTENDKAEVGEDGFITMTFESYT